MHNLPLLNHKIVSLVLDDKPSLGNVEYFLVRDRTGDHSTFIHFENFGADQNLYGAQGDFHVIADRFIGNAKEITIELEKRSKSRPDWDTYFLKIASVVSERADCRRRMVGCVIVDEHHRIVSTGYNGAPANDDGCLKGACPRGLLSYEEVQASTDYDSGPGRCISLHAEANALLYAGKDVRGATAYITDPPCPTCTKLLKGAGVARVVVDEMRV